MPNLVSNNNQNEKIKLSHLLGAIVSILTIISLTIAIVYNLQPKIFDRHKPSISTNPIDYYYSKNINVDTPVYELQSNEYMQEDEIEYMIDNIKDFDVQEVIITNNNPNTDISLTEFKLIVENIMVDYSPNVSLEIYRCVDNKISFNLKNKGWKDINNLKIELSDTNNALDLTKYDKVIDNLEYGTSNTVQYEFDSNDFFGSEIFYVNITVKYDENILATYDIYLQYENGELLVYPDARGAGGSRCPYGICFSTDKNNFTCIENIQENIKAGEALELPVLLFPDRSCSFDYYIEFKVDNNGEEQTIRTKEKHSKYIISSLEDLDKYDYKNEDEILKEFNNVDLISYPYCKKYQEK